MSINSCGIKGFRSFFNPIYKKKKLIKKKIVLLLYMYYIPSTGIYIIVTVLTIDCPSNISHRWNGLNCKCC